MAFMHETTLLHDWITVHRDYIHIQKEVWLSVDRDNGSGGKKSPCDYKDSWWWIQVRGGGLVLLSGIQKCSLGLVPMHTVYPLEGEYTCPCSRQSSQHPFAFHCSKGRPRGGWQLLHNEKIEIHRLPAVHTYFKKPFCISMVNPWEIHVLVI